MMLNKLLEEIYPIRCLICGQRGNEYLCPTCRNDIKNLESKSHFFISDFGDTIYYYGRYTKGISTLVKKLKYSKKAPAGGIIAEFLSQIIMEKFNPKPSLVVPIPISFKKLFKRGSNQCEIIGKELSLITGIKMETSFLKRRFELFEKDQVALSKTERKENLKSSFYIAKKELKANSIILLDDVSTTGRTINICKELIFEFRSDIKIYPLVFAH
jgi:ComF family protein